MFVYAVAHFLWHKYHNIHYKTSTIMKKSIIYYAVGIFVAIVLVACNEVTTSDPVTAIDDLDTSVEYKQIYSDLGDSLQWAVEVYKDKYDRMMVIFQGHPTQYYAICMPFPSDSIFASGKYTTLSGTDDRYHVGECSGKGISGQTQMIGFKKCQMYVTRTDIPNDKYSIHLYIQSHDRTNEYIHHEGKVKLSNYFTRY